MQEGGRAFPGGSADSERDLLALETIALELGMLTRAVGTLAERLRSGASGCAATSSAASLAQPGVPALTRREREVATLLRRGLSNKEIALALAIRPATAKAHVRGVMEKLGARTRTEAAVRAASLLAAALATVAA